jgi:hypothetical protein
MKSLKEREGEEIVALLPFIDRIVLQRVKLHKVEDGGIWITSQKITEIVLAKAAVSAAPKTLVWFLPWHQVTLIMDAVDEVSLSEKGLGL